MVRWECGIEGDSAVFDRVEDLLVHQATEHDRVECKICGTVVPDGYFAIRHAFDKHSRAEYVRAYDAAAADVRRRETVREAVEDAADVRRAVERVEDHDLPGE